MLLQILRVCFLLLPLLYAYIHTNIFTSIQTYINTYAHEHIYTHIHTHSVVLINYKAQPNAHMYFNPLLPTQAHTHRCTCCATRCVLYAGRMLRKSTLIRNAQLHIVFVVVACCLRLLRNLDDWRGGRDGVNVC